jgi:NAD(P)H-nitrite reductase large subunit
VYVVRTAQGMEALHQALCAADSVCIVGASVLGVEIAAQTATLGKQTTLVGSSDWLMPRHLNRPAADMLMQEFARRKVHVVLRAKVERVDRGLRRGLNAVFGNSQHEVDLCVFCAGVQPNSILAQEAGLSVKRGILVDRYLQTSHPDVYAAGDAAEHANGEITGLWHAAEHQGLIAGANAAGGKLLDPQLSFRLKCEVFGRYFFSVGKRAGADAIGLDCVEDVSGDAYRCLYFENDTLCGVVMVDDRERAKAYEAGVRESWARRKALAEFDVTPR